MPGGHKNAPCTPKEIPGAHQSKIWVPTMINATCPPKETLGTHQKTTCAAKQMLRAQQDVSLSPKHHVPTKNITGCPTIFQVAPKMPGGHQKKGWLPIEMAVGHDKCDMPNKQSAGCPPRRQVPTKGNVGCLRRCQVVTWCKTRHKHLGGHQDKD